MTSQRPRHSREHPKLDLEYEQANENFRLLTDIRFKLLGLLPVLGGAAAYALAHSQLSDSAKLQTATLELWLVALIAVFGFTATLGVAAYDQRNSELYNGLLHRLKYLEHCFNSERSPGALRKASFGGQFVERPPRGRVLFWKFEIGHDRGLALIYGAVLGAWVFPAVLAILRLASLPADSSVAIASLASVVIAGLFVREFLRLDNADRTRWNEAATRDGIQTERAENQDPVA